MINIIDKVQCCGCESCVQACPHKCISFEVDEKGFGYPMIDKEKCKECGLCEKVCPMLNSFSNVNPRTVQAAINHDANTRYNSSSGGIFSLLAECIINKGGVVFGARFDESWLVCHDFADNVEDISKFRGSKYVQSKIGSTFLKVKEYLNLEKPVLFSGTPCQAAALRRFLRKEYTNLYIVDVLCHGVPSPLIWNSHLNAITEGNVEKIKSISFRDKTNGWYKYGLTIKSHPTEGKSNNILYRKDKFNNPFLKGFMFDCFLRDSCYNCRFKEGRSASDIMLADYWGADIEHPDLFDNKGCSCVLAYTEKGTQLLNEIDYKYEDSSLEQFIKQNPSFLKQNTIPANRDKFWEAVKIHGGQDALIHYSGLNFYESLRRCVIILLQKTKLLSLIKK